MIFDLLRDRVNSVVNNFDSIVVDSMMDSSDEIIEINVMQLEEGLGSDGAPVGEYASEDYALYKQAIGSKAPLGVVDTKDEGDFHNEIYTEPFLRGDPDASGLFVDSRDWKSEHLQFKYLSLFGIAPENSRIFTEEVLPNLKRRIIDGIST